MSNIRYKRVPIFMLVILFLLTSILTFASVNSAYAALTPLKDHVAIGYWIPGDGGSNTTLAQVDSRWDVVVIPSIETRGSRYETYLNLDLSSVYSGSEMQQFLAFRTDIQFLKNRGQKVIVSCGGQNSIINFSTLSDAQIFLDGVIDIIDEYGFEGFDIDFEGSSMFSMNIDRIGNLITMQSQGLEFVLRGLVAYYGDSFIISASPEYRYVQGGAIGTGNYGVFLPILDACRDIITYIHPKYVNGSEDDFSELPPSANAGSPFSSIYSKEGCVRLTEMLITGFVTMDKGTFIGLDPSQVAYGIPTSGAGYYLPAIPNYAMALSELLFKYPDFRGIMGLSISLDEVGGYRFINDVALIIDHANNNGGGVTPPTQDAQTPVITSQPVSKTVLVNGVAELTVNASVTSGNLSYLWYKSVSNFTIGTAIRGATNATYRAPTSTVGTTNYYCVITNTDPTVTGNPTATATTNTVSVTVNEQNPTIPSWSATQVYIAGDQVTYKGRIYQAKWWNLGETPGMADVWELIGWDSRWDSRWDGLG